MKDTTSTLGLALTLFLGGIILGHCVGCHGAMSPSEAEAAYTAQLLKCVDDARTLAESKACRQRVDAQWGITEIEAGAR